MQLCTGSPSTSTVQAPQSPASHPFFTPNKPSSRRKCAGIVRGAAERNGSFRSPRKSCRAFSGKLAANLFGKLQRHVPAPRRRAVNIVVIMRFGISASSCSRNASRDGRLENDSWTGRGVDAVTVRREHAAHRERACRSATRPSGRAGSARFAERPYAGAAPKAANRCSEATRPAQVRCAAGPIRNR